MDWIFWLPIILGAVIGLVVSIVANLVTPSLSERWRQRRVAKIEETKRKAFERHARLLALHSGSEDKYLYFIGLATHSVLNIVMFVLCAIIGYSTNLFEQVTNKDPTAASLGFQIACMAVGTWFIFRAVVHLIRFWEWQWRLNHFAEYEKELKERYGEPPPH